MKTIDLSGLWYYETDLEDTGIQNQYFEKQLSQNGFRLPGSTCDNALGIKQEYFSEMNRDTVRAPLARYSYIGPLWLQREIIIPEDWRGQRIRLFLERVNIASEVWIDGQKAGRQFVSLCAPHTYDLSALLTPGRHLLTLRIDNSNLLNLDGMSSGYSNDTQSIWNGIIGKIQLECEPAHHLENLQVFPEQNRIKVRLTVCTDCASPHEHQNAQITLAVSDADGATLPIHTYQIRLHNKKQIIHLEYPAPKTMKCWDEFHPVLYEMTATLACEQNNDTKSAVFGMRVLGTQGRKILLNGRQISLRGTLDCCIYPHTGYPPTDLESWLKVCRTVKEYGLNHIRFHSWCPPENAFLAADQTGVYLLAEMPLWLNTDVCALATGDDPIHETFFHDEAMRVSRYYGNHPSFIMFSNGNELLGDFEMLENITTQIKALDPRRLYTLTSNFDRVPTPADDYFSAFESAGNRIRLQTYMDELAEDTCLDFKAGVNAQNIPVISFEVGQYCVYPQLEQKHLDNFNGNLIPTNLMVIRDDLKKRGLLERNAEYVKASGIFAARMYKEEIEAVMRTPDMGGFQLLDLHDYPGQCTATVGILDAFWQSKEILEAEQFRRFCAPAVPLLKAKRIFQEGESFEAELIFYDFRSQPHLPERYQVHFFHKDIKLKTVETEHPAISIPLDFAPTPCQLRVEVCAEGVSNDWRIWVYPKKHRPAQVPVFEGNCPALESLIENGGKAIVLANNNTLAAPIEGMFRPVFWSPAYFPSKRNCGMICNEKHPIFEKFPTDSYSDFQWKQPVNHSFNVDLSDFPRTFKPLIEFVPNFFDNTPMSPLFEARVGKADIIVCGFDLSADFSATRQLADSIYTYAASSSFAPKQFLSQELFRSLWT